VSAGALITVVGIGADGWPGLTGTARAAILSADEVIGSDRQLASLPGDAPPRRPWPSPITPLIDELVTREAGAICVLASGDPMLHGIGATLARRIPRGRLAVISHASALALACAHMGWPEAEVELISAVGRPPDVVARMLQPAIDRDRRRDRHGMGRIIVRLLFGHLRLIAHRKRQRVGPAGGGLQPHQPRARRRIRGDHIGQDAAVLWRRRGDGRHRRREHRQQACCGEAHPGPRPQPSRHCPPISPLAIAAAPFLVAGSTARSIGRAKCSIDPD